MAAEIPPYPRPKLGDLCVYEGTLLDRPRHPYRCLVVRITDRYVYIRWEDDPDNAPRGKFTHIEAATELRVVRCAKANR